MHQVSIMTDWVLLGLIAALVVLLLLTVFGFVVYSGLFTEVVVSAGSPPVGSMTLAYKFRVGPYGESGQLFTDGCSISSKLCSIGVYYDNPHTVRCAQQALRMLPKCASGMCSSSSVGEHWGSQGLPDLQRTRCGEKHLKFASGFA